MVRAVGHTAQGSSLSAAAAIGALSLTVYNPVDFDEDGGTLDLNGARYDYETVDLDSGVITLNTAIVTTAGVVDDRVLVVAGGKVAVDYTAFVSMGDGDEVEVAIPFAQRHLWPEGE